MPLNVISREFVFVIKIAFVIGILAALANYLTYDVISRIMNLNTFLAFFVMQVPLLLATCLNAYRHSLLVRMPPAPFIPCLTALLLAAGLNLVTPARLSEFVKVTYLRQSLGIALPNGITAIFVERLYDVLVVATIALLGFVGFQSENTKLIILFLSCALFLVFSLRKLSQILLKYIGQPKNNFVKFLLAHLQHIIKVMDMRILVTVGFVTLLSWAIHCSAFWLFFYVLNEDALSISDVCVVFGAMMFAGALPSLPGGLGVVQLAVSGILIRYGFAPQDALLISLVLHFSLIFISAACAPFLILTRSTGVRTLLRDAKMQISAFKK
jgi:uncharacterized protein (TIRG00374 family)